MELTAALSQVKSTLATKPLISVKNLVDQSKTSLDQLADILNILLSQGKIRMASAKGCSNTCTSCPTCFQGTDQNLTGNEIVISMISNMQYLHADD
ncbi:MAG TPA: FeoC-like transcriptional regulator [Chitinispirillaceae bacterium]|nr:FeoC-like transcriptional regulator [Chitinispirillaceae bacterium]